MNSLQAHNAWLVLVLAEIVFCSRILCENQIQTNDDEVLARVGPRAITAHELRERIEMTPWPGKDNPATADSSKVKALLSLVAEALMSMQAIDQGFIQAEKDPLGLDAIQRVLARDELYKREIVNKVSILPSEVEKGIARYAWRVRLNSFRVDSKENAVALMQELHSRKGLHANTGVLARDTLAITFGDLTTAIEDSIYSLDSLHEFSMVELPDQKWVVMQFLGKEPNPALTRSKIEEREYGVRQRIRKIKEQLLLARYSQRAFNDKTSMDSTLFRLLADSLLAQIKNDPKGHFHDGAYTLSEIDIAELMRALASHANSPFITSGGESVTLAAVIGELNFHPIRFQSMKRRHVHESLNQQLRQVADASRASEHALRLKLDEADEVKRDLNTWRDALQADRLFTHLLDSLERTDSKATTGDALVNRRAGMVNRFIAGLAERFEVEMYFDKLKEVAIVPFNMVTKRYVGFGGAMLARPFLLQLWNWGEVWDRARGVAP